jgi:tetratricopeptide (TPR) repeat protein
MTADQQSALTALRAVEPIAARLDRSVEPEDRAADILELWQGTETALRALMGGSSLSGQGLIRELRQRELISLGQAYALLEFLGARDRSNRTTYRATDNDVVVAREGFRQLEGGLAAAAAEPAAQYVEPTTPLPVAPGPDYSRPAAGAAPAGAASATGYAQAASRPSAPPPPPQSYAQAPSAPPPAATPPDAGYTDRKSRIPANLWFIIALVVLVLAAIGAWALLNRRGDPEEQMSEAVAAMQAGRREAARGAFMEIARQNPELATPHVFLSRLSREEGDLANARRELETAIRLEPKNAIALREMGLILFSAGNYELARRFFVRSLTENPEDKASMGYLGCSLSRLNRFDEAQRFIQRAGSGAWSSCLPNPRM